MGGLALETYISAPSYYFLYALLKLINIYRYLLKHFLVPSGFLLLSQGRALADHIGGEEILLP